MHVYTGRRSCIYRDIAIDLLISADIDIDPEIFDTDRTSRPVYSIVPVPVGIPVLNYVVIKYDPIWDRIKIFAQNFFHFFSKSGFFFCPSYK